MCEIVKFQITKYKYQKNHNLSFGLHLSVKAITILVKCKVHAAVFIT